MLVVAFVAGELLLVRQFRPGTDKYYWALPAGYISAKENVEAAAARELQEETGYHGERFELVGALDPLPGYVRSIAHIVTCTGKPTKLNRSDDEIDDIRKVSWAKVLEMIREQEICEMQAVAAILFVNQLLSV